VIEAHLDAATVSRIRWAPSPVLETVTCMALAASGRRHPLIGDPGPSARYALRDRNVAATALLAQGCLTGHYMPDVMTPKPELDAGLDTERLLTTQLDRIRHTATEAVESQLRRWAGPASRRRSDAETVKREAATGIAVFWRQVMAERWPTIRSRLLEQQEIHLRAAAASGIGAVLNSLHPSLRWDSGRLEVNKPYSEQVTYRDTEVVLAPTLAAWPRLIVQLCDPADAVIAYPVVSFTRPSRSPARALLGRGRDEVLRHTGTAVSTTELSRTLHMAPSTVSYHLSTLFDAGLVSRIRAGRSVLYTRTEAGQRLIDSLTPQRRH
jgi:DNA-binding transcriptional ArsR family regulator